MLPCVVDCLSEKYFVTLQQSRLGLVKKRTGEFIDENEVYILIEYKILICERKTKMLFD